MPSPRFQRPIGAAALIAAALAGGCSTERETKPPRTATEQLLISTAADRAAERVAAELPSGGAIYLDAANFDSPDGRYTVATLRDSLLKRGARLVRNRDAADTIVEVRAGALSIDDRDSLVGIPNIGVPIPLAGTFDTPEIALFKRGLDQGVAKLAATAYDAETGALVASTGPQYGTAHKTEWTMLLFFSWDSDDLMPDGAAPEPMPWD